MPMGGDWALTDARNVNGSLTVDVRQTFKTDDGAFIQVFETGQLQPDGSAFVRLGYETGSPKYEWLNSVVALGIIRTVGTSEISIDTWQVSVSCRSALLLSHLNQVVEDSAACVNEVAY